MNIALDAMGGDFAPSAIIEGAFLAKQEFLKDQANVLLIGRENEINQELERLKVPEGTFTVIHADEVVEMGEHPTKAFSQKPNSSIAVGYGLLKAKKADVFCSAGNTGAMLVGAMFTVKAVEGIIRPGIAGFFPKTNGRYGIALDVGANADCKADVLGQFADIGSIYYENVFGIKNPRVGLLNLGEEESKGTLLTQAAYQLLKLNKNINFIGNIEGGDVFTDKVDVVICDGFTGNVVLKLGESIYEILTERKAVDPKDPFINMFDYASVGGSPILGINGNVIIGHGKSNSKAIKNMLNLALQTAKSGVSDKIKDFYK